MDETLSSKRRPLESHSNVHKKSRVYARSGKWTPQEESFANQLIVEFEGGSLQDCEDGCTLRAYLARKLNCAPMRISKKFAGRCIGKVGIYFLIISHPNNKKCILKTIYVIL